MSEVRAPRAVVLSAKRARKKKQGRIRLLSRPENCAGPADGDSGLKAAAGGEINREFR